MLDHPSYRFRQGFLRFAKSPDDWQDLTGFSPKVTVNSRAGNGMLSGDLPNGVIFGERHGPLVDVG